MTQETDSMCACKTCAIKWSEEIARCDRDKTHKEYEKHFTTDLRKYNGGYIYNGIVVSHMDHSQFGMLDGGTAGDFADAGFSCFPPPSPPSPPTTPPTNIPPTMIS